MRALVAIAGLVALPALAGFAADGETLPSFTVKEVGRLVLDDVVAGADGRDEVRLFLRAETSRGEPIDILRPRDVLVRDAGQRIDADDIRIERLIDSELGTSRVLVLDWTGRESERAAARDAALAQLSDAHPFDRVAVITVAGDVVEVCPFSESRDVKRNTLLALPAPTPQSERRLLDGVALALERLRADATLPRRGFVVVVASGSESGSEATLEAVLARALGDETTPRIPVFGVGAGDAGHEPLARLARETDAAFVTARDATLANALAHVTEQLQQSFVVSYPARLDGATHAIQVDVTPKRTSREARFPEAGGLGWLWLAPLGLAIAAIGGLALARSGAFDRDHLEFQSGPQAGERVPLRRRVVRIGALPDNDVVIDQPGVSRYHATLYRRGGRVLIEDRNSTNRTFVNGYEIESQPLRSGDKIRIAGVELVYVS